MNKKYLARVGWSLSIFFIIGYIICLLWEFLLFDSSLRELHHQLLAISLPGFKWLSIGSFILGLVEVFVYGWIAAIIFVWVRTLCCRGKK